MQGRIGKLLIANRGEIALRVIRTCQEMGIQTVAVYSDVDARAPFVRMATESYPLHGSTAAESYLDQTKILTVARDAGVDAIHPGYGFLAENDEFSLRCQQEGFLFVGPPPEVIRALGDKTEARSLAASIGIPIVPGSTKPVSNVTEAAEIASGMKYPVLLKAAGGGGGKGMRVVEHPDQLESHFDSARSEAKSAFDDDRVYIEKYIESPRHIEIQILADRHGNLVHLGERECSIQRRHQKVIEESPSTAVDSSLRERMAKAALQLCAAAGYENAGTVEFLLDRDGNFYFLEVNTRLQVEHPVTEMVTGIDLVREQIRITEGAALSFKQTQIRFFGHALECRVYAEDPHNQFFPATGTILYLRGPGGPFVRDERGVDSGCEILPYYDPMISKLVTWGRNRSEAIERMARALNEYEILGVTTNINMCSRLMAHPSFQEGRFDTSFLLSRIRDLTETEAPHRLKVAAACVAAIMMDRVSQLPPERLAETGARRWTSQGREELLR